MVEITTTLFNNGNILHENEIFLIKLKTYKSAMRFITEHKRIYKDKCMYWIEKV